MSNRFKARIPDKYQDSFVEMSRFIVRIPDINVLCVRQERSALINRRIGIEIPIAAGRIP